MNIEDIEALPVHPYAALYPLIDGDEFDALVESVKASGVRIPLSIFNGQLIDGRNRLRAARAAGRSDVPAESREGDHGEALRIVGDMNAQRRHLTTGQRAAIGARLANISASDFKGNQHAEEVRRNSVSAPVSVQAAASAMGVSRDSVVTARKVDAADSALLDQVLAGKISLNAAEKTVDERRAREAAEAKRAAAEEADAKFKAEREAREAEARAGSNDSDDDSDSDSDSDDDSDSDSDDELIEVEVMRQLMYWGVYAAHERFDCGDEAEAADRLVIAHDAARETEDEDIPGDIRDCWPVFKAIARFVDQIESRDPDRTLSEREQDLAAREYRVESREKALDARLEPERALNRRSDALDEREWSMKKRERELAARELADDRPVKAAPNSDHREKAMAARERECEKREAEAVATVSKYEALMRQLESSK